MLVVTHQFPKFVCLWSPSSTHSSVFITKFWLVCLQWQSSSYGETTGVTKIIHFLVVKPLPKVTWTLLTKGLFCWDELHLQRELWHSNCTKLNYPVLTMNKWGIFQCQCNRIPVVLAMQENSTMKLKRDFKNLLYLSGNVTTLTFSSSKIIFPPLSLVTDVKWVSWC